MGLENKKLKKRTIGKTSHPHEKAKVKESKKTKKLQKEIDTLKKQVHQTKKEGFEASRQWEKKYTEDIGRYKKERAEMKIWMQADKIKLAKWAMNIKLFNLLITIYNKTSKSKEMTLILFAKNIVVMLNNKKN